MKLTYMTPDLEIENYKLDTLSANACGSNTVNLGPAIDGKTACSDYGDNWGDADEFSISAFNMNQTSFYAESSVCSCYYSAGGEGYFQS